MTYEQWLRDLRFWEAEEWPRRKTRQWETLARWARELGWTHGAEIGVARGWTLFYLLDAGVDMIGVDQWQVVPDTGEPGHDDYMRLQPEFCARMVTERARNYGARCRILHMDSVSAASLVADASLDFCFIDADHRASAVRADILAWAPKVRAGGWLTGHDWQRPEVAGVLDELLPGWERHENKCWRREA